MPDLSAAPDGSSSTNVTLSTGAAMDGEPYIAVNPTNPKNIVVAWMHVEAQVGGHILVRATMDGGSAWGPITTIPHSGSNNAIADPSIAFDRHGRAYLTFINWVYVPNDGGDVVVTSGGDYCTWSSDGGVTWSAPIEARDIRETPDDAIDRPWVAVDISGGSRDGWIYMVTRSLDSTASGVQRHVHLKRSSDGGATWSSDIQIDDAAHANLPATENMVAVNSDGVVTVVYLSPSARFVAARSSDGAATFAYADGPQVVAPGSGYFYRSALAANPGAAGGLALVWTDGRYNHSASDVLLAYSADDGTTWSAAPVRVNDDAMSSGVGHDFPWVAFAPSSRLVVDWRDRRRSGAGPYTTPFDIYYAYSDNHGAMFSANARLSDQTSPSPAITQGNDFYGVAVADNAVVAAWSASPSGYWEVLFGSASLP